MPPEPQTNQWLPPPKVTRAITDLCVYWIKAQSLATHQPLWSNGDTCRWLYHRQAWAHSHRHTYTCKHTSECLCAILPPRNYVSATIYLVKGEMGRAGSVLSAYFSKTINSVHKTQWIKLFLFLAFAASEIMFWQAARFKVSINVQNKPFLCRPLLPRWRD